MIAIKSKHEITDEVASLRTSTLTLGERFVKAPIRNLHSKRRPCHEMRHCCHQDEAAIVVNMSADDLQQKYDGNLNSEMIGPLHNLIAKVGGPVLGAVLIGVCPAHPPIHPWNFAINRRFSQTLQEVAQAGGTLGEWGFAPWMRSIRREGRFPAAANVCVFITERWGLSRQLNVH